MFRCVLRGALVVSRAIDLASGAAARTSTPIALAAALVSVVVVGCSKPASEAEAPAQRPTSAHLVAVYTAKRESVSTAHERPGSLRFRRLVRIYSQEEGRITELRLYEGDRVKQGQLLVRLDDDLLRAQADKARATREQKALDLKRLEELRQKRAVSDDELAQARTALAVAQADERLLTTRLAFTRVHAPFAGVITERLVEPGDFVTKNTHLLTLADPGSLVAEVYASELVLPQVAVGDPVEVRIDALGASHFQGRILRVHPSLNQTSRQGIVEIALDPIPAGARAGQFVRATLTTAGVERLLVPFRALRQDREGEFVWLVDADGKARRRAVRSGLRIADRVEILDGLSSGERVITRGFLGLAEGKAVKVVKEHEPENGTAKDAKSAKVF
ncbi:MAG: efflux RND transporter periplasmic adaptor subunit [Chromatiaceae bacterium]